MKIFSLLFGLFMISEIIALPRFAIKQGDRCVDCHVNPTGGIIRNEDGFYFGKNTLSLISPHQKDLPLSPAITDNLIIGFDYRTQILYSQEKNRSDFQDMSGSLYMNASISEKIDVITRYDFVQSIWEAYAVGRILPNESYIKVGSFVPYYGIRIDDHTAYSKGGDFGLLFSLGRIQGMFYNPFYIETGIELGAYLTDNTLITASMGKPKSSSLFSSDPTFTLRFETTRQMGDANILVGASYVAFERKVLSSSLQSKMYGGFAGFGLKYFSLMGEYDIARNYVAEGIYSRAVMLEAAYKVYVGIDAIVRYDYFDYDDSTPDNEFEHIILGFEFFPYSFIEVRPQYRINLESAGIKNNAFVLQFHFWY
ncbi:hypothetical protein ACSSV9_01565 [Melioribacter sp. OK-6-Me]